MDALEYYNNMLCIQGNWLINNDLVSESNYKQLCARNQLRVVRRGGNGRTALVDYNSIPARYKEEIAKKLGGDPTKITVLDVFVGLIVPDVRARDFYDGFVKPDGKHLTGELIGEYYTNAIVLNATWKAISEKRGLRRSSGNRVGGVRRSVFECVRGLHGLYGSEGNPLYPHTLPDTDDRLGRTLNGYRKEGYVFLIHGGIGRRNAAKVDDDVKESVLIELIGDGRNLDFTQVAELYNIIADKRGWKRITASAVRVWAERYDLETYPGRHGGTAFKSLKTMQAKRSKPSCALYFWSVDGWDVELLYQERVEDRKGNVRTTYHNRPTVVVVLDPSVNYPIGYAIGRYETPTLIRSALRNAVHHTAELFGRRYRTMQLQSDRYQLSAMLPFYEVVSERVTPASVRNAKTKPVERHFGVINNSYCHVMKNWSGYGVTSRKENQPNVEQLNKLRDGFPDWVGVCDQVKGIIELIRREKRDDFLSLWSRTPAEHKVELKDEDYLYVFGSTNYSHNGQDVQKYLMHPDGITATICGERRTFDCFDLEFRRHVGVQWTVLYDPDDLRRVLAVNDDRTLRFILEEKYVQPMALIERKSGDAEELGRVRDFNGLLGRHIVDVRKKSGNLVHELFEEHRELDDTLTKLLIVDSKGQHKDRKNDSRRRSKRIEVNVDDVSPVLSVTEGPIGEENDDIMNIYSRF